MHVVLYFLVILGLGFYKGSKKDINTFLLSGRKLTTPALVATLVSTWYGGILEIGRFTYENGIIKGKWRRSIVDKKNTYNLDLNNLSRPVMTLTEEYKYSLRKFRSVIFNQFPNKFRTILKG